MHVSIRAEYGFVRAVGRVRLAHNAGGVLASKETASGLTHKNTERGAGQQGPETRNHTATEHGLYQHVALSKY